MALFDKLLGRKPFATLQAEAKALQDAGQLGQAKLAFEKARDAKDATAEDQRAMQAAADSCCDGLSDQRVEEAQRLFAEGHMDLAYEELKHALDTAVGAAARDRAQAALEAAQRNEFQRDQEQQATPELDADARFEALSGHWEMAQHSEYANYGPPFREAFLALSDGQHETAAPVLEELLEQAEAPCYLWLEVARARGASGDEAGTREALAAFLAALPPNEGDDARLSAHATLAALLGDKGEIEAALGQFEAALEQLPDDPRVYLAMGSFMRRHDMASEALEVLYAGLGMLEEGETNFRLWLEAGLAHAAADQPGPAIERLEQVVEHFATRQSSVPVEAAVPLAQLHEKQGNTARAADLYRALADASAGAEAVVFHCEAARLLTALGLEAEARRMLIRGREALAQTELDPEAAEPLATRIEEGLAALSD